MSTIGDLIYRGVFDRFPDLRLYFAETQAAWLPHSLNWADEFFLRWYGFYDIKLAKLPSEYVRQHCRFSFIVDRLAMKFRYYIGLDLLMWGSDFPIAWVRIPTPGSSSRSCSRMSLRRSAIEFLWTMSAISLGSTRKKS